MIRRRRKPALVGILLRCVFFGAFAVLLVFAGVLALDSVAPPVSTLMFARSIQGEPYERDYVRLDAIAPVLIASVVASEDGQFCSNGGVDWASLNEVMSDEDGPSRGASTITMQTAKNLFLWPGRSAIRKGLEIGIALMLGEVWTKPHTLEVYLNIAEWGDGLFGVEAASRHYFGKSAADLDAREAALLASALPNPIKRNAGHPSPLQRRLAARLMGRARGMADYLGCLPR